MQASLASIVWEALLLTWASELDGSQFPFCVSIWISKIVFRIGAYASNTIGALRILPCIYMIFLNYTELSIFLK